MWITYVFFAESMGLQETNSCSRATLKLIFSLDAGLRMEVLSSKEFADHNHRFFASSKLEPTPSLFRKLRSWGHPEPFGDIEYVTSELAIIQHAKFILHLRRQWGCDKIHKQGQKSYNVSCITHTSCRFGSAFWVHQLRSDDSGPIRQHSTAIGRHPDKRIIHWRQMDATDTTGQYHDAHHINSKQFVCFFCGCHSFIFQRVGELPLHRQARRKSQFIAQQRLRLQITRRMPTRTITRYLHQNTKLEATCVSKILKLSP